MGPGEGSDLNIGRSREGGAQKVFKGILSSHRKVFPRRGILLKKKDGEIKKKNN